MSIGVIVVVFSVVIVVVLGVSNDIYNVIHWDWGRESKQVCILFMKSSPGHACGHKYNFNIYETQCIFYILYTQKYRFYQ